MGFMLRCDLRWGLGLCHSQSFGGVGDGKTQHSHVDTRCYVTDPKKMPGNQGLVNIPGWYCLMHVVIHGHWKT